MVEDDDDINVVCAVLNTNVTNHRVEYTLY